MRSPDDRPTNAPLESPLLPHIYRAEHVSQAAVDSHLRDGTWARLRRGVYVDVVAASSSAIDASRLALANIRAVGEQLVEGKAFSHASAAMLHGLPMWRVPSQTHISQGAGHRVTKGDDIARHVVKLTDGDVTSIHGFPTTSLLRTVVDCLHSLHPRDGLVVADAALRGGLDGALLRRTVMQGVGRRNIRRAREIVRVADRGAESPGESVTRYHLLAAGLPAPRTQVRIETALGVYWTDLGWPEWGVHAEYDGEAKYDGAADERFFRQKRRDDAIADAGGRVRHFTRHDLRTPEVMVRRVLDAFPRGAAIPVIPRPYLHVNPVAR